MALKLSMSTDFVVALLRSAGFAENDIARARKVTFEHEMGDVPLFTIEFVCVPAEGETEIRFETLRFVPEVP